jgi:phosphoribosylformimino-5-aminoimidazole carboxamide ribotide isomerase
MPLIIIPAVDIMDHHVVQLVGGVPGSEQIIIPDPYEVAMSWVAKGAPMLHLVDLDGAFGKEDNSQVICRIIKEAGVPVQVGGGIRSEDKIEEYICAGAHRVIVGTKAVKDTAWLCDMARKYPKKIMLALDTKNGEIAIKGWQESAPISLDEMFGVIRSLPLAGVLNTNVDVEGKGNGIDEEWAEDFISRCPCPVVASGGVTTHRDAMTLSSAGADGAVVGIAIYTGRVSPWEWGTPWKA